MDYYTLPLRPDKLLKGDLHEKCSLKDSIIQNIRLVVTTAFGEMPEEELFGCGIWDHDFDNLISYNKIREKIKQSVTHSINAYEKRLQSVKIDVSIKEEELINQMNGKQVKKRLDIQVSGTNVITSEPFYHREFFYTGPFSNY